MKKYRLKKAAVYTIYALTFISVFSGIYFIEKSLDPNNTFNQEDFNYVSQSIFDNDIPVVSDSVQIIRPYTATDVEVVKNFYDYQDEPQEQENSLIFFEETYLQNTGVLYSGSDNFDVVSILDGTVISIKEDNILGKCIEIRHDNDMVSVYQSLSEILVKENDVVKQGDKIGKSGLNNLSKELGDHLHFEMIVKGQNVNPEEYYEKVFSEI